jgi:hypothetical protein
MKRALNILLPFIATLFLWRLSSPVFNPNGILALVPIFYYSIVNPRGSFLPMALLGCFLLDRNFDTMLFWTALFCLIYAGLALQNFINPTAQKLRGIYLFMIMIGIGAMIQGLWAAFGTMSMIPIWTAIWMFAISNIGYIILTYLFEKAERI